ncbi:MAG TPA: DUF3293 domain-containing protein [Wenzhouxiangellaceae bacterium]|nr:DUF3293 domain-containing protein [Wenzhouxiangellaceae bacterium]
MQILAEHPETADPLVAAFAAAEYVAHADGEDIVIRIGQSAPVLDRALDGRCWAVITAHNPGGVRHALDDNAAAQRTLEKCLRELRPTRMLAVDNRDPSGQWPDEPAWLFTFDDISVPDGLARRFGQRAIVTGHPGGPAILRLYRDSRDAPRSITAVAS